MDDGRLCHIDGSATAKLLLVVRSNVKTLPSSVTAITTFLPTLRLRTFLTVGGLFGDSRIHVSCAASHRSSTDKPPRPPTT